MPAKTTRSMRSNRRDGLPAEDPDLLDNDLEAAENRLAARKIKQSPTKAAKKRKQSESVDSDDESQEDDDYDSEEMNSFIADDEEAEREMLEAQPQQPKRDKKKKKNKIRQLEEEDIELINENVGLNVQKKKRLNRNRDVDNTDLEMKEQPTTVKEEERHLKPTDRLQNIYKHEEIINQKNEPADYKKRQRLELEDQSRQQKQRKIFGDAGVQRSDPHTQAKPSNLREMFSTDEIDDPFNTERDHVIAETDIPERLQVKLENRLGASSPEDLQQEAKWILDRLQTIPDAENKLGKIAHAKGTEEKVLKVLNMIHKDYYDIPMIVKYRKYEYSVELDEDAVWHIWNLDQEYARYQRNKNQIHDFLTKVLRFESSVKTYLEELKFAQTQSELNNFNALIRYLRFIFAEQLSAQDEGKKQPQSRDEIQIARANKIHEFCRECFIESKEFQENLSIRKLQNSPPEPKATPNTVASEFAAKSKVYSEPSDLLQAACRYAATELASQPAIRNTMKKQLREHGVITATCTDQGKKDLDIFHQSYRVKLVENTPLLSLQNTDLYLDIEQCEKANLITVKVDLRPLKRQEFKQYFEDCYMDVSQPRQGWNKFRELVIKTLIDDIMFKEIVKEVRDELHQEAEQAVITTCKRNYTEMLMTGPFQTALHGQEVEETVPIKKRGCEEIIKPKERLCVMGALMHQIDANNYMVTIAVVNKYGTLVHHKDFMRLLPPRVKKQRQGMRDGQKDFNMSEQPKTEEQKEHEADRQRVIEILDEYSVDLIVVAANCLEARNLMELMRNLGIEIKSRVTAQDEHSKKQQHVPKEAFVIWGSTEVAKLFALSHYSQKLHKGFQQILKQTVSMARYEQCPMTEILKLWSPIVAENQALALNLDPLQKLVNQSKLADALEECNIRAVNKVGIDFNLILDHEHMQCILPFISGLGYRKAKRIVQKAKSLSKKISSRGELLKNEIITMKIYYSAVPFLLIRIPVEELEPGQANKLDILDQTRIHHEHYRLAMKIATDARQRSENQIDDKQEPDKAEQNLNCREVIQRPQYLKNLDLRAYYQQLDMSNQGNLRIMIDFIIEEFRAPFADPRNPRTCDKTGIENEKLFYLLLDESKRTFKRGLIVTATVTHVFESKALCRLENGLTASIMQKNILEADSNQKLSDAIDQGFIISGRIESIKTQEGEKKFEVELNCKKGDLHNHDNYLKDLAESIGVDHRLVRDEDKKNQNFSEQQKSNKPQSRFVARRIAHDRFKNITSKRALTELEKAEVGDFIFRPSTRSEDAITLTWKFWQKQFVHIDIQELDKMPGAAIGQTLVISNERYDNLREIVERYIIPCNRLVREVVQSPKWSDCEKWEDLEEQLKDEKASDKARIPYRFAILPQYQQYVVLAYVPRERVIKEFIKVRPKGFYFHEQNLAPFPALVNWFKDQWQTKDYQRFLKRQKSPRTTVKLPDQQQQMKQNPDQMMESQGGPQWQAPGAGSVFSNHGVQYSSIKQESRFRGRESPAYGQDRHWMKNEGGRSPHAWQQNEDIRMQDQYESRRQPQRGGDGCFKCGQSGHFARECPNQGGDRDRERDRDNRRPNRCYNCQQEGHISRDCPQQRVEDSGYKRQKVEGGSLRRNADGGYEYSQSGWENQGNSNWGDQQQNNYTPRQDHWGK